jgi:amino acid transporter
MSIGVSALFGFFLLLCLLFSIQNFDATVNSDTNYGEPVFKILVDVFGEDGALVLISLIIICVWHCGLFSMTSNSRMMFAFSRDGALPRFFDHVDQRFKSPVRTVWLAAFLAFCLSLPSLGSSVAFSAATSIATIGLYISYALPILISVIWPQNLIKGPFDLGRFSRVVGIIACLWVCLSLFPTSIATVLSFVLQVAFITIVFCLPTENPVTEETLNYTPVAVGIVLVATLGTWILWAHRWFKGPTRHMEEIEAEIRQDVVPENVEVETKSGSEL